MWRNIAAKQKLYRGNTIAIHIVFFFKTTKLNSQPPLYKKIKFTKTILKKKRINKS
jgi:hypothetical protein